jgi:hypothetical protein
VSQSESKPLLSYKLNLFADYYQFYLQDEQASGEPSSDWGDQLVTEMVAIAPGRIGVGTVRNMMVPVSIDLLDARPPNDFAGWDHITEASLNVPSGQIVIAGCSDYLPKATRLPIQPGSYRVRIYYGGLGSVSENGLEGEDHYRVVIWPEEDKAPEILKKW